MGRCWGGPPYRGPRTGSALTAHIAALDSLEARAENEGIRGELAWARQEIESHLNPIELVPDEMADYTGTFGPRRILVEDNQLFYQREERPKMPLVLMGEDLFRVGDIDYFRLQFERDEGGRIHRLTGMYDNGRREAHARSS